MVTFRPIKSKLLGYIGMSLYMISVPTGPVTLTSPESNLPMTQTSPTDARNRSAATAGTTAGCFETCFSIGGVFLDHF